MEALPLEDGSRRFVVRATPGQTIAITSACNYFDSSRSVLPHNSGDSRSRPPESDLDTSNPPEFGEDPTRSAPGRRA